MSKVEENHQVRPHIPDSGNRFLWGFLTGCALHLLQVPIIFFGGIISLLVPEPVGTWLLDLFIIGPAITQLFYLAPAWIFFWIYYRYENRRLFALGLLVNACLFFLVTGLCGWSVATIQYPM